MTQDYFTVAKCWADDRFLSLELSRKRYQIAFLSMSGLVGILVLALIFLLPLKKIQLAIVHEGPSGETWISTLDPGEIPTATWAKTKSELAQYVRVRETYDPILYPYESKQLRWFNNDLVQDEYLSLQDKNNLSGPLNFLGDKGFRTIVINSVVPLDLASKNTPKEPGHINLAQVNFVATDHYFGQSEDSLKTPYTVLISWGYAGIPSEPSELLANWDGLFISKYQRQVMNIDNST